MNIKDYFSFTKGEKRGVVILLTLITFLIVVKVLINQIELKEDVDFSKFSHDIEKFEKEILLASKYKKTGNDTSPLVLFEFNPNTASNNEWEQLGFKAWQIKAINKYKSKGGQWRIKSDVKKIFGLEEKHYEQLKPFILLPDNWEKPAKENTDNNFIQHRKKLNSIFINSADTSQLKELKGIGSTFAKRIIKFRDALGGFVDIQQISEVYGLEKDTYEAITPFIKIDTNHIKKININEATSNALKQHPYVDWKVANAIIKYRNAHGSFESTSELGKIHLIDKKTLSRITPYLITD